MDMTPDIPTKDETDEFAAVPFLTRTPSGAVKPYKFDPTRVVGIGPPPMVRNSDMTVMMMQIARAKGIKIVTFDK